MSRHACTARPCCHSTQAKSAPLAVLFVHDVCKPLSSHDVESYICVCQVTYSVCTCWWELGGHTSQEAYACTRASATTARACMPNVFVGVGVVREGGSEGGSKGDSTVRCTVLGSITETTGHHLFVLGSGDMAHRRSLLSHAWLAYLLPSAVVAYILQSNGTAVGVPPACAPLPACLPACLPGSMCKCVALESAHNPQQHTHCTRTCSTCAAQGDDVHVLCMFPAVRELVCMWVHEQKGLGFRPE